MQIALGERVHREQRVVTDRAGDRLGGPRLEVHDALSSSAPARTSIASPSSTNRPHEATKADRVVLRAVALPVAGDHLRPAPPTRRRFATRSELVHGATQRLATL